MPKQVDDTASDLFVRLGNGSSEALNEIIKNFRVPLLHLIARYIQIKEDAGEVFMDTMLAVWIQRSHLVEKQDPVGWMFRIARNKAMSRLRKGHYPNMVPLNKLKGSRILLTPANQLENRDLRNHLETAIGKLGKRRALIFRLHVLEGKTGREIATILGLSENTVRNHLARARIRLRRLLAYQ